MNNKTLMISSSVLAASLFLGAGSAQAHTTNNNNMEMNEEMGHMNNNMDQQGMEMGQTTMMPYYNYDGYTTYDGQFTKDYDFVRALQHDNVMIDGYKVNTAASDKDVASSKVV